MKNTIKTATESRTLALQAQEAKRLAQIELDANLENLEIVMENIETAASSGDMNMVTWDDGGDFDLEPHLTPFVIEKLTAAGYTFKFNEDSTISRICW